MGALDSAVRQGKALYIGISSYSAEKTAEAAAILIDLGTPLLIHQPSYSMLNRWIEPDLLDTLGELFFLDEATAFAAGHRPCALCRREDYVRFVEIWGEIHPGQAGADAIDAQLHAERVEPKTRGQLHHQAALDELPNGSFVLHQGAPHLVLGSDLLRWTAAGYLDRVPRRPRQRATLITPPVARRRAAHRLGGAPRAARPPVRGSMMWSRSLHSLGPACEARPACPAYASPAALRRARMTRSSSALLILERPRMPSAAASRRRSFFVASVGCGRYGRSAGRVVGGSAASASVRSASPRSTSRPPRCRARRRAC